MSAPMTPDREQEIAETAAHLYEYVPSGNSRWDWLAGEAVPELLAEVDRLRARVAELEAQANCPSQMTVSSGTSRCALPVRHGGYHRNVEKNHHWSDEYDDAARVRPVEDPHDSPLHHTYALGRDLPEVTPSCTAPHSPSCSCASGEYRFCGASLGRDEYPFTCNRRVAHQGPCSGDLDEAVTS